MFRTLYRNTSQDIANSCFKIQATGGESPLVMVTFRFPRQMAKYKAKKLSLSNDVLVSLIGGNIGFWLGVSVVQALSIVLLKTLEILK